MSIRNFLFKSLNKYLNNREFEKRLWTTPSEDNNVFRRMVKSVYNMRRIREQVKAEQILKASKISNELERAQFNIISEASQARLYDNIEIDNTAVLNAIDKIQLLRNIKLVEENESAYDPELVKFEKLKADVLLEKEGAFENLQNYIIQRPYMKKYVKWVDLQEQTRYQYLG